MKHKSPEDFRYNLTVSITEKLVPSLPNHCKFLTISVIDINDEAVLMYQTFFQSVYDIVKRISTDLEKTFETIDPRRNLSLSIEELIDLRSETERFSELFDLVIRAKEKEEGKERGKRIKLDTLKALDFIIESNKRRPD